MMAPDNLLYTEEHEWLRLVDEEKFTFIGITDFAQEQLGEVVYVDLPEVGSQVIAGDEFGSIESVKASSDLYSPVSGKVIEVNEALKDNPEAVNQSPYDEGWMIKVSVDDLSETHGLMDVEAYQYHVQRLEKDDEPLELGGDDEESLDDDN